MIIDGKTLAAKRLEDLKNRVLNLPVKPKLVGIMLGDDPASRMYLNLKKKRAEEVGIASEVVEAKDEAELVGLISKLNSDQSVTGILVQLPLPKGVDTQEILAKIDPAKDVDGLTGRGKFLPATVQAVFTALEGFPIEGQDVTIIGRSREVGRPLAVALIDRGATVTVCNSKTKDLAAKTKTANILISATGKPHLIQKDMVKPGAIVIDVGITKRADGTVAGDVDFEAVSEVASAITPVPGGIGPLTVVCLLENTLEAAKIASGKV